MGRKGVLVGRNNMSKDRYRDVRMGAKVLQWEELRETNRTRDSRVQAQVHTHTHTRTCLAVAWDDCFPECRSVRARRVQ